MKICFTELVMELSHALDFVEAELLGVQTNHSKRVAFLCVLMGKRAGLDNRELLDLMGCAVLHDNALTEYVQMEYLSTHVKISDVSPSKIGLHCTMGERNVQGFPFFGDMRNVILYHHENADGTGPFSKRGSQVGLYARLIHLADQLDSRFALGRMDGRKWRDVRLFVSQQTGTMFSPEESELFLGSVVPEHMGYLEDGRLEQALEQAVTFKEGDFSQEQLMSIGGIFARIVDYKSTFTSLHSMGIAHKVYMMGAYYGLDGEMKTKLYLAGALHDIGKLAVDVDILEKPGRLDDAEFEIIKGHAKVTYDILNRIHGMEDICRWASLHHEKLNGTGYPFGLDRTGLGLFERLMACIDIYQALREDRPYKKGKSHEESIAIMDTMVSEGLIDGIITRDIDRVFCLDSKNPAGPMDVSADMGKVQNDS